MGAKTMVGMQLEAVVRPHDVVAEVTRRTRFFQRGFEALVDLGRSAVDVVVADLDAHREGGNGHALDHDVGLCIRISRSLHVPGSPVGVADQAFLARNWRGMKLHFRPVRKPAPPRPRSAEV